jgi:hypothetical protein
MNGSFKYNVHINQYAAVKLELDVDIIDLAIFDFIKSFAHSSKCIKLSTPEGEYFWIQHKWILDNMPLLKIKSNQGVINRVDNLIKAGLLKKHPNCDKYGKSLYTFGENYDAIEFFDTPKEIFRDPSNNFEAIINNKDNNSSSNSPIINNSPITPTNTPFIPQGGKPKESGKTELDFSEVQPEFGNIVLKWLTYKKERKQTYKQMGFNSFYKKLIKLSGGDPNIADMIVEQSMANNYQGIFELKGGNNGNSTSRPTDAQALKAAIDQSWGPGGDPLADIL